MKKNIIAIMLILSLFTFVACKTNNQSANNTAAQTEGSSTADADNIAAENGDQPLAGKHMVIGTSASYKNFETVIVNAEGEEEYEGLDIDLVEEMAQDMGFTYEFVNMQFSGLIGALQADRVDFVISGMTATDERRESVDFSDGYIVSREAFLVMKDSGITSVEDLEGKTISCSTGTSYEDLARSIPNTTVTTFDGQAAVLQELLSGRTDAMVTDGSLITGFMEENPQLHGVMLPQDSELNQGVTKEFAMAFPKDSELVPLFNEEIQKLKDDGTMDELITKWLGEAYIGE